MMPEPVLEIFLPNDKENIAPYRVLHFLALAFLVSYLVPRDWRGFQWPALQPLMKCGEEWLPVFCAGVFLSFAGHFILITGPDSLAVQILVSIAGMAAMTGVAYYVSWSRRQDQKPALPRNPDEAATLVPTAHSQYEHGSIGWPDRSSQTSARQPSCSDRPSCHHASDLSEGHSRSTFSEIQHAHDRGLRPHGAAVQPEPRRRSAPRSEPRKP